MATTSILDSTMDVARLNLPPGAAKNAVVVHAEAPSIIAYATLEAAKAADPDGVVASFSHPTDRGGPRVFKMVGQAGDARVLDGFIEVLLPIRPNGSSGWVKMSDVDLTVNPYRIEVDTDDYRLRVFHDNELMLETTVAIGTGDTPTPRGQFYLIELLKPSNPNGAYGPYAYGLSGYSDTLQSFNGGNGVIGIHGTNDPGALGGNVSHGCIRVANEIITEMASYLPLGTPVHIGDAPAS